MDIEALLRGRNSSQIYLKPVYLTHQKSNSHEYKKYNLTNEGVLLIKSYNLNCYQKSLAKFMETLVRYANAFSFNTLRLFA